MTIDPKVFEQNLIANLIDGVDIYTERMVERMKRKAPVSKNEATTNRYFPVRLRRMGPNAVNRYIPKDEPDRKRQASLLISQSKMRVRRNGQYRFESRGLKRLSEEITSKEKNANERFIFSSGPLKNQVPDALTTSKRGALLGVSHHRPGTLRDSIASIPAALEGSAIVGGVTVGAYYAPYVEYGFIHRGKAHRYVKSRPFFRPVWKDNQAAGADRLARYVKRAGK